MSLLSFGAREFDLSQSKSFELDANLVRNHEYRIAEREMRNEQAVLSLMPLELWRLVDSLLMSKVTRC